MLLQHLSASATSAVPPAAPPVLHAPRLMDAEFGAGDLVFVRPPPNSSSAFDAAVIQTGEATVQWLRAQGSYAPNATSEVASHVAIAWRNGSTGSGGGGRGGGVGGHHSNSSSSSSSSSGGGGGGAAGGDLFFVQALPGPGVVLTPAAEFWSQQPAGTLAYRAAPADGPLRAAAPAAAAAARAAVGAPYASDFEPPSSGAFYCSSLVEWGYEQALRQQRRGGGSAALADGGSDGATTTSGVLCPSNFTLLFVPLPYWKAYYAALGLDLPLNATGSNPTLLLHSPRLAFAPAPAPAAAAAAAGASSLPLHPDDGTLRRRWPRRR